MIHLAVEASVERGMEFTVVNDGPNEAINKNRQEKHQSRNCFGLYGQVTKRIRWMPWQSEAMKDVVICEKRGGVDKQALIPRCPNGETHPV